MIDLQQFCSTDETRGNISLPFPIGDYTYATNRYLCIRVPRHPSSYFDCAKLFGDDYFLDPQRDWIHAPEPVIETVVCAWCKGAKNSPQGMPCDGCDGKGSYRKGTTIVTGPLGVVWLNSLYLESIRKLPAAQLGLIGNESDDVRPVCIKFDGGLGVIMPIRKS